jgi:hypothetical protein
MADDSAPHRSLIEKIGALPPSRIAEVEDFVDFLRDRDLDRAVAHGALAGSQAAFAAAWDNSEDEIYDGL